MLGPCPTCQQPTRWQRLGRNRLVSTRWVYFHWRRYRCLTCGTVQIDVRQDDHARGTTTTAVHTVPPGPDQPAQLAALVQTGRDQEAAAWALDAAIRARRAPKGPVRLLRGGVEPWLTPAGQAAAQGARTPLDPRYPHGGCAPDCLPVCDFCQYLFDLWRRDDATQRRIPRHPRFRAAVTPDAWCVRHDRPTDRADWCDHFLCTGCPRAPTAAPDEGPAAEAWTRHIVRRLRPRRVRRWPLRPKPGPQGQPRRPLPCTT